MYLIDQLQLTTYLVLLEKFVLRDSLRAIQLRQIRLAHGAGLS